MNYSIIIMTSVTAAKRAQKILEKNGINSTVIRTPGNISVYGCSNSLKIKGNYVKKAIVILNKLDFNIREIYNETYDGREFNYAKQRM